MRCLRRVIIYKDPGYYLGDHRQEGQRQPSGELDGDAPSGMYGSSSCKVVGKVEYIPRKADAHLHLDFSTGGRLLAPSRGNLRLRGA